MGKLEAWVDKVDSNVDKYKGMDLDRGNKFYNAVLNSKTLGKTSH